MTGIGITLFALAAVFILTRYYRAKRPYPFPPHGMAGAAILLAGEALLFARVEPVAIYFTAIAWTGYILWADAAVFSLRGKSLLKSHPMEFTWIAFCSVPLWLIFEAYNLRLRNWVYVGLPGNWLALYLGYAWAFSTIWPAIFETATLLRLFYPGQPRNTGSPDPQTRQPASQRIFPLVSIFCGVLLLSVPVLVPSNVGSYLFGAVWLGFIFLLEPINGRFGCESLWRDFEHGDLSRLRALLLAGLVCGIFWEFWNYWATARWVYTVPILPEWRIFAMPMFGYLGFPVFALECFAMLAFLAPGINRVRRKFGKKEWLAWETLQL